MKAPLLAWVLLAAARFVVAAPVVHDAVVQQPRAFGYVLGDVITQRVLLEDHGRAFTPDELPTSGPAGNWVERRAVRVERDEGGHSWLTVDYQIMNSPQTLSTVALPAWRLASKVSGVELRVPEWSISVAPLTPRQPIARAGLGDLRPDRRATLIDLAPMQRWLAVWVAAFLICLVAWIGWWLWRNWRASSAQPFARALRELRGVDEGSSQAWVALHRAFDGTAGRVVQPGAVSVLFERAPQFEPQRMAIERFFAESAQRFFSVDERVGASSVSAMSASASSASATTAALGSAATGAAAAGAAAPGAAAPHAAAPHAAAATRSMSIRALCLALRRIEKRHES